MDGIYGPDEVLYDQLRTEGVYCQPGMDAHAEFIEGIPKEKRRMISSKDPHAKHLDEWATDYGITVSKPIERISNAVCVTKRKDKAARELLAYKDQVAPEPAAEQTPSLLVSEDSEARSGKDTKRPITLPFCPKCGGKMKPREGRWGTFWGCSSYPRCRGTLSLKQAKKQAEEGPPEPPKITQGQEPSGKRWNWRWSLAMLIAAALLAVTKDKGWEFWFCLILNAGLLIRLISVGAPKRSPSKSPQKPPRKPSSGTLEEFSSWFKGFRKWLIIGSLTMSIMGLVGFAEFMYEEALQQTGFGGFMLKSAGLAKEAYDLCEVYERRIDRMARFTYALGWLSPFNWDAYRMYVDSARTNVQSLRLWAISREPALAMKSDGPLPTVASVLDKSNWTNPQELFDLEGVVDYQDAERHIGQTVRVLVPILGVEQMDTVALAVSDSSFIVVCFPSSEIVWDAFPSLASTWSIIEGKIQLYNGVPEIVVTDWSQIKGTHGLRG